MGAERNRELMQTLDDAWNARPARVARCGPRITASFGEGT